MTKPSDVFVDDGSLEFGERFFQWRDVGALGCHRHLHTHSNAAAWARSAV
jgi:hypothetical protein